MPKQTGLGKGLDALIPGGFSAQPQPAAGSSGVLTVPVAKILRNPRQPRAHFNPEMLDDLAASIKEHGIIQPLLVSQGQKAGEYMLIAGERRWKASQLAGLLEVPVVVRQTTDQERLELALIENIQRADLNPIEEANAYRQLSQEFGLSHEQIGARVGKSRSAVSNTLRLLELPEVILQALVDGTISEGHARALLGLPTEQARKTAFKQIVAENLNVRATEELVRNYQGKKTIAPIRPAPSPELNDLKDRIETSLQTRANVKVTRQGMVVSLFFSSDEELEAMLARLK